MGVRLTCIVLTLTTGAALRTATAQNQNPASIPTDLALALFDRGEFGSGRGATQIVVGQAPEGMPQRLTSFEGGTVLGGARFGQNSVVVVAFTLPPNQVLLSADRQLRARGLMPPPPPPDANRGGFVSNADYPSPWGNAYCADSATVMLGATPAPNGGTYLRVSHTRNQQFGPCTRGRQSSMFEMPLKFPTLLPPPGMASHGGGSGMGSNNASASARLTGLLKPADIVAHYRAQLDAAGWRTRTPITSGDEAALTYLEATDSTGTVWRGVMTAVQWATSEVEVEIEMFGPAGR